MVRVLIAEDDRDTQEALRQALTDEGYTVSSAYDGQEALAAIRASAAPMAEPMVVLLDLYMGQTGGDAVLRTVAADPALAARHRYIVVSAVPERSNDVPHDLLQRLGIPFIAKPFDLVALLEAIQRAADDLMHGEHAPGD